MRTPQKYSLCCACLDWVKYLKLGAWLYAPDTHNRLTGDPNVSHGYCPLCKVKFLASLEETN